MLGFGGSSCFSFVKAKIRPFDEASEGDGSVLTLESDEVDEEFKIALLGETRSFRSRPCTNGVLEENEECICWFKC
jgi:hypothetical protein